MAKHDDRGRRRPGADPDDLFWNGGEPAAPYERAGGGRHLLGAAESEGEELGPDPTEEEAGHSWQRFFEEPIAEPTLRPVDQPYGGRRYAYGREGYFGDPFVDRQAPTGGEGNFGSLYGRSQRDYAHRRRAFYSPPETGPSPYFVPPREPAGAVAKRPERGKAGQAAPSGKRPARRQHRPRRDVEA